MPEGPEIHMACSYINNIADGKIFNRIVKSEISKCHPISSYPLFTIHAQSRGKEIMINVAPVANKVCSRVTRSSIRNIEVHQKTDDGFNILLHFGMSGSMKSSSAESLPKHAHLQFWMHESDNVLSFVDPRRYGGWKVGPNLHWSADRGPCLITEFNQFKDDIMQNIDKTVFLKPVCEVLLNQRYFNGVGNYLRAEALYRCQLNPFAVARDVLQTYGETLLQSLHELAMEVVNLGNQNEAFDDWLQCYAKKNTMLHKSDSNKRTIWYSPSQIVSTTEDSAEKLCASPTKRPKKV